MYKLVLFILINLSTHERIFAQVVRNQTVYVEVSYGNMEYGKNLAAKKNGGDIWGSRLGQPFSSSFSIGYERRIYPRISVRSIARVHYFNYSSEVKQHIDEIRITHKYPMFVTMVGLNYHVYMSELFKAPLNLSVYHDRIFTSKMVWENYSPCEGDCGTWTGNATHLDIELEPVMKLSHKFAIKPYLAYVLLTSGRFHDKDKLIEVEFPVRWRFGLGLSYILYEF